MMITNQRTKNYYIYKAKWIPDNPIETFGIFVEHLVTSEKILNCKIERLSSIYEDKYGYKLPLFILHPILDNFASKQYAKKERNEWKFNLNIIPAHNYDSVSNEFIGLYNELVDGFVQFYGTGKISAEEAETLLNDFINENNVNLKEIKVYETNNNAGRYKLAQYIKFVQKNKKRLYDFLIELCEATLIKSYILNEGCKEFTFSNKIIVLDTPVILRALGYEGAYLEREYKYLLKCLVDGNCRLEIFEHTLEEVYNILYSAKDWVESFDFDITQASDVCIFFRAEGKTKQDIVEIIESLKDAIAKLNIGILAEEYVDWKDDRFLEKEEKIESLLKPHYARESSLKADVKSVMEIYLIRKNNKIKVLKDTTHFFLTSNTTLAKLVSQYNFNTYPKTISPFATDMFMGMLACGEKLERAKSLVDKRILSYCYSGLKPTIPMREKFIELVEAHKDELDSTDYLLLKNHPLVCDALIEASENEIGNISEVTIWDVLREVKETLIADARQNYEKKLVEMEQFYSTQMDEIATTKNSEISKKDSQIDILKKEQEDAHERHLKELHCKDIEHANREWKSWKRKANLVKIFISIFAIISIIASIIGGINFANKNGLYLALCIIGSIFSIMLTPSSIISWISHNKIVSKIYMNAKRKIAQDYSISPNELTEETHK